MKITRKACLQVLRNTGITVGLFFVCTAVCFLFDYFKVNDLNFLIIYVLGILLTAVLTRGFFYSSALSIISVFGYNFCFTVPRMSFHINDSMYLVTFFLMFVVGLGISAVTYQLKKRLGQIHELSLEKIRLKNEAEKEQVKAALLRSISHDLRTPLTAIKNGAELLELVPDLAAEDRRELLSDMISKSDWTIRLVENLLSLTRIDSQNLTVKKTAEALEEILPQAVRNVNGILGNRTIRYEMPQELLLVPMDATLIIQVVGNILANAVRHTEDSGNIWIKAWSTGKNAVIRISNDGEAIRDADLSHLFEMYYTTGDGGREGNQGLGLAICRLIVSAHGGKIEARNADGRVVFEFNLPMEEMQYAHIDDRG